MILSKESLVAGFLGAIVGSALASGIMLFAFSKKSVHEIVIAPSPTQISQSETWEGEAQLAQVVEISPPSPSPKPSPSPAQKIAPPKSTPRPSPKPSPTPLPSPSPASTSSPQASPSPSPTPTPPAVLTITGIRPSTIDNSSGNLINIDGSGFLAGAGVIIGSSQVQILSISSSLVSVRVHAGFPGGAHDVTIINPDGKQVTLQKGLTVNAVPSPSPTPVDSIPPKISDIRNKDVTPNSAYITWTTDEPAISRLDYGQSGTLQNPTSWTGSYVTAQSIYLTGLAPNTTYSYRVHSKDAASNLNFAPVEGYLYFVTPSQ